MKLKAIILYLILFVLFLFFIYSFWIAPFSIYHGYYVGAAKLMAQGLIPWKDFNIMDMPLGIWLLSLPYKILGIDCSGNIAVFLQIAFHSINVILINKILSQNHVELCCRVYSLIFYLLGLYSLNSLMVQLEPFSVTFMLLGVIFINKGNYINLALSSIFLNMALFCKLQVIILLPVIMLYILFIRNDNKKCAKKVYAYMFAFVLFFIVGMFFVFLLTGNKNLENLFFPESVSEGLNLKTFIYIVFSYATRWSFYLYFVILLIPSLHKRKIIVACCVSFFVFVSFIICQLIDSNESYGQLFFPFVVFAFGIIVQELPQKKIWCKTFIFSLFIIPSFLAVREYSKLDGGLIKQEQEAIIDNLNEIIKENSSVALFTSRASLLEFGPQIYSEVPVVYPYDMKNTNWGLNNWKYESQNVFVLSSIENSDYILFNEDFLAYSSSYNFMTGDHWDDVFQSFLDSHDTMSIGEISLIINK